MNFFKLLLSFSFVFSFGTAFADSPLQKMSLSEFQQLLTYTPFLGEIRNPPSFLEEPFDSIFARMSKEKAFVVKRQMELLNRRYDLANNPSEDKMTRGKPLQAGVRVKLSEGVTWDQLGAMTPEEIKSRNLFPEGFLALPHVNHPEGGMVFPRFHIEEILKQENRDLNRFDVEFDIPEHFLAEFPAAIYLTTRPDLGDVSQGEVVTRDNFVRLFGGILNPKQLDGLRLLTTPFAQQQFNHFDDRRSMKPHIGVSCLDCHSNGHTNNGFHLVGDRRSQEFRPRLDTPSLRGVHIQRLFGSQRGLRSVEDFTEFEQRAAYFDGDPVAATKKGMNPLDRGTQVHHMAEFQSLLDFPPAPKLDLFGKLDPTKATEAELRGEQIFNGKARCNTCHSAPYYTDNLAHDLKLERFYTPRQINGMMAFAEGRIKTFPLRGIKDSPPYFHDGRLLTLEDTVEFFNLILQTRLTAEEKADLTAFLKTL
ncbi:MAG: cytochrome B6 [Pseudobdellovibrionaceae bacterium]